MILNQIVEFAHIELEVFPYHLSKTNRTYHLWIPNSTHPQNVQSLKKKQVKLYDENIIPALKNNYKSMQLGYEQNTEELFMLYDAWETLYMTQLEYTELLNQALKLQVTIERIIEKK